MAWWVSLNTTLTKREKIINKMTPDAHLYRPDRQIGRRNFELLFLRLTPPGQDEGLAV